MDNAIKEVISNFSKAIADRDIDRLGTILHPDFVVMANRFKGGNDMTTMPKTSYLNAMEAGKVGGTPYDVEFLNVAVFQHNAIAEILLNSKESDNMHLFLSLVQNSSNQWQIVCDLPIIVNN